MKMKLLRRRTLLRLSVVLLLAGLACSACGSESHMYKHKRSHCDCPTF